MKVSSFILFIDYSYSTKSYSLAASMTLQYLERV